MAERLKTYEVEGLARSMAMAPLSADSVARLVRSYGELSQDWSEVEGLLDRLGRVGQLRSLLNELKGAPVAAA